MAFIRIGRGTALVGFQFLIGQEFRVLREHRLWQAKGFLGRRGRQERLLNWIFQQVVKLNVQPEGWCVVDRVRVLLKNGHKYLLSHVV
jgi:hypothetical protein